MKPAQPVPAKVPHKAPTGIAGFVATVYPRPHHPAGRRAGIRQDDSGAAISGPWGAALQGAGDFLRHAKVLHPETLRLVLSSYTDLKSVTDAISDGTIFKFMTKPWEDVTLRRTIADAFRTKELADDNRRPTTSDMPP